VQELVRCIRLSLDCADACAAAGRMPARPRPMLASSAQRSKPARRPVAPAARSVTGTPSTTTTVASAPAPAAAASRPTTISSPRPANQTQQRPPSRVGPLAPHVRLAAPALGPAAVPADGRRPRLVAPRRGAHERSSARDVLLAEGHLPLPRAMRACRQPHEPRALWTSGECADRPRANSCFDLAERRRGRRVRRGVAHPDRSPGAPRSALSPTWTAGGTGRRDCAWWREGATATRPGLYSLCAAEFVTAHPRRLGEREGGRLAARRARACGRRPAGLTALPAS
jgi:hypothetical protein